MRNLSARQNENRNLSVRNLSVHGLWLIKNLGLHREHVRILNQSKILLVVFIIQFIIDVIFVNL